MRAPALLECVAAMAASPHLAPVLAGHKSLRPGSDETPLVGAEKAQGAVAVSDEWPLGHK